MTVLENDFDLADGIYDGDATWEGMIRNPLTSLTAAAIPVRPPSAWFTNPGYARLEPLTVTADGQIGGHIASWREDHIGMNGRVKAPRSKSGYAFFATGCLETAEGTQVNVGQITLTGGHASLEASVAEAVAHYDNTNSAFADVAVGEDKHGIWVAGALRPTVDDGQLRAIRASSVSGDWRPINGSLEMVAVCAVNVPGFPIPRARVASGVPVALVAAGTGELVDLMLHNDTAALEIAAASFDDRLRFMENIVLGRVGDSREALTAAVEVARQAFDDEGLVALRARVHGAVDTVDTAEPATVDLDALRARVRGVSNDAVINVDEAIEEEPALAAALRSRVHGPITAAALRERVHGGGGDPVPFADGPLPLVAAQTWDDSLPIDLDLAECRQVALRAQVSGGVTATATKAWNAEKREKAASSGAAMPGGRFPIKDCTDVGKAVRALGRGKGDKAAIRAHIKKRAKALGCMGNVPDDWK